jgi:hypothetical protein
VAGTQTVTLNNGLPTFTFGPDLTSAQKQFAFGNNSLSNNANGNFDVSHLNTKDFARGLMAPLSPVELDLLLKQGVTRELLFNLAIEGFEYTQNGERRLLPNEPLHEDYQLFRLLIEGAVRAGFSIETRPRENPLHDAADKSGLYPRIVTEGRFCFDPVLNRTGFKDIIKTRSWLCGGDWAAQPAIPPKSPAKKQTKTKGAEDKAKEPPPTAFARRMAEQVFRAVPRALLAPPVTIIDPRLLPPGVSSAVFTDAVVRIRSLHEIFSFLGQLVAHRKMELVMVQDEPEIVSTSRSPLLVLTKGQRLGCFAEIRFEGEHYCVPSHGSGNTKRVFSILSQLIALKTQQGDLPFYPTVRIVP